VVEEVVRRVRSVFVTAPPTHIGGFLAQKLSIPCNTTIQARENHQHEMMHKNAV
jgi:hypothetical protein